MQDIRHYDIIVIGSGPAGEKGAMQASKLKKQVATDRDIATPRWSLPSHRHDSIKITTGNSVALVAAAPANSRN